jgi:hypothetical protein
VEKDLVLATATGRRLRYGPLEVMDAAGQPLEARFELGSPGRVRLVVQDAQATYPIVIDPDFHGSSRRSPRV